MFCTTQNPWNRLCELRLFLSYINKVTLAEKYTEQSEVYLLQHSKLYHRPLTHNLPSDKNILSAAKCIFIRHGKSRVLLCTKKRLLTGNMAQRTIPCNNTNSKSTYRQILGYNNPILRQAPLQCYCNEGRQAFLRSPSLTWIILSVGFVYRTFWN